MVRTKKRTMEKFDGEACFRTSQTNEITCGQLHVCWAFCPTVLSEEKVVSVPQTYIHQ
jgi:hypothetical protein